MWTPILLAKFEYFINYSYFCNDFFRFVIMSHNIVSNNLLATANLMPTQVNDKHLCIDILCSRRTYNCAFPHAKQREKKRNKKD